jgi:hypothetical protein
VPSPIPGSISHNYLIKLIFWMSLPGSKVEQAFLLSKVSSLLVDCMQWSWAAREGVVVLCARKNAAAARAAAASI